MLRNSLSLLLLCSVLLAGCGRDGQPVQATVKLNIAAASDLQHALPILAARFKLDTGIEIVPTLGSSGTLAEQIKNGAPYDLFLSANLAFVENLAHEQIITTDSVKPYARGRLVLVLPRSNDWLQSPRDLAKAEIKTLVLANPSFAPYGTAARQVLEKIGLWDQLESKRVLSSNVREALQFVESGNADAGFVGSSLVQGSTRLRVIPVEPDLYAPIVQGMGIVSRSTQHANSDRFAKFLLSEPGQGILRDLGFATVPIDSGTSSSRP